MPQEIPMFPVTDWTRQSRSMCLPWTGDRPVMYVPYTCAGDMPGSPGREVRLCCCEPVGFQNSATGPDLGFYAARSYSLIRPPRTGRRFILSVATSATGWSGRGGRSWQLR
jgi:hypothetical protein